MSLKDAIRLADAERKQPESNKAANTANSEAVNTASGNTVKSVEAETPALAPVELANLTVRVPKSHRVHWLIGAKREGTSLTAAITEAMNARYGQPTDED